VLHGQTDHLMNTVFARHGARGELVARHYDYLNGSSRSYTVRSGGAGLFYQKWVLGFFWGSDRVGLMDHLLKTPTPPLLDLLDRVHTGDMVLPDFQRDFVWEPSCYPGVEKSSSLRPTNLAPPALASILSTCAPSHKEETFNPPPTVIS